MIEFQLIDDTEDVEVNLIDNTDNIEVELIKEIDSYNQLKDQPSINNVTLTGNKTLHDLGIQQEGDYPTTTEFETRLAQKVDKVTGKGLSTNDYTTPEKNKLASLENYDDTEIRQLIDTKQPRGDYLTEETDPTVPNHVKTITQNNITNWNNKQEQLISGTNIKTINNTSILGSGNIEIESGGSDYSDLTNKPKINNVELNGNKTSSDLGLQPAGNYLTSETDPVFSASASSGITSQNISNWNNKAEISDIPDVSDFITNTVNDLVNYYKKSETFTKQEVNDLISAITTMDIQVVQTLPTEDISTTTIYLVPKTTAEQNDAYDEYIYVSNAWEHIGSTDIDLSGYQTKIDSSHKLSSDLVDDTNNNHKFVSSTEKTTWNGKYTKPSGGIPKSDLESSVQTSLGKADTAIQSLTPAILKDGGSTSQTVSLTSGTGTTPLAVKSRATSSYISFSNSSAWIGSIGVTSDKNPTFYNGSSYTLAYTSDIPTKTSDLTNDSGYITSYTETDPTVPSHVKNITQANITSWNNKSDFSGNYNDLSNKPTIPDELSDLSDDSTHRLVTDTEKTTWNGKANVSDIPKVFYGTSATGASTAAKVVVCEEFTEADLVAGTRITVLFTNANTYNGQATLNINGTGAKNIYYNGSTTNARYMWVAGETVDFIYNGTQWATINGGLATTSYYGVTKLATGANSDSQAYALTPRSLYYLANYSIAHYYSASKTYAVGDKVRYSYYIYECITAIETPEAWNAEHWQQVDTIQEQIDAINTTIGDIDTILTRLTTGSGV